MGSRGLFGKTGSASGRPIFVDVSLRENDRFLTLAFTDGGDGCGWDWTIFGDPRLELIATENGETPDARAKP